MTRAKEGGEAENYITGMPQQEGASDATYGGVYVGTDPAENAHRTVSEVDSNNVRYTYSVPEYSSDNHKYTYEADEKPVSDYFIDVGTDSRFTNYHLTDFSCKVNWGDSGLPESVHKSIDAQFIASHFELLDETVDGYVYDALKVRASDLEAEGFPEETKKFIQSTYTSVTETGMTYYKVSDTILNQPDFPETVREWIHRTCDAVTENDVTYYKLSDEILRNPVFTNEIKTLFQNQCARVTDPDVAYYVMDSQNIQYVQDETDHSWKIVVSGLQEITANGTAKVYALKPKKTIVNGIETVKQIPVHETAGTNASQVENLYTGASLDSYLPQATNTGVRSSIVDRAYQDSELSMVLTGIITFEGDLLWADSAKTSERQTAVADGTAGDFMLYRYVDKGNPEDSDMVSQVGTWKINSGNRYIFTDSNGKTLLDKYDNTSASYFYYAKERLSLEEYETDYLYPSDYQAPTLEPFDQGTENAQYNGSRVFLNGATVKNSLTGAIGYTIDAKWIAAELQGGTAEIQYKLQRYNSKAHPVLDEHGDPVLDEHGNPTYTGDWENVYPVTGTRINGGVTEYQVNGEWVTTNPAEHVDPKTGEKTYDGLLTIDGFSAEQMEKLKMFNDVRKYDDEGNLLRYRVVQTNVSRTDNGATNSYPTDIEMAFGPDGTLVTETESGTVFVDLLNSQGQPAGFVLIQIGSNRFEVRTVWDGANGTFYYEYKLVGDVQIVMNKDWSGVPVNQLNSVRKAAIRLQLMKYNYQTGKYEPFDEAHGNPGGLKYTNGTKNAGTGELIEYENTVEDPETHQQVTDKSGVFTVERTNIVEGVPSIEEHYAIKLLNVPMYDEDGRLNRYSLQEAGMILPEGVDQPQCSPIYAAKIDQNPMLFTANNIFGDGGEEIHFKKVWMDDGEEEYKDNVRVDMSARGMQLPFPHSGSDKAPSGWEGMTDQQLQDATNQQGDTTNSWLFQNLWTANSPYDDPFPGDIGYQYVAGDGSVPKSYVNVGTGATVDYRVQTAGSTGDRTFLLQKSTDGSSWETVSESGLKAVIDYSNVSDQTYSQNGADRTFTLTAPGNLVNGYYSVTISGLPKYQNQNANKAYNYTNDCIQVGGGNQYQSITLDSIVVTENETTIDLTVTFRPESALGTGTVGNSVTFAVRPSYNENGNNTKRDSVVATSAQSHITANTAEFPITGGQFTIPASNQIFGIYSFRINGLAAADQYRLAETDGTTVIQNTLPANDQRVNYVQGYHYEPVRLPLAGSSQYSGLTGSDATKLDALNTLLTSARSGTKMLNTGYEMKDDNVWTSRVQVRIGYSYHPRSSTEPWGYDLRDFAEHIESNRQGDNQFFPRGDIQNSSSMSATQWMNAVSGESNAWISMLPEQYKEDTLNPKAVVTTSAGKSNIFDLSEKTVTYPTTTFNGQTVDPTMYPWLSGVYQAVYTKNNQPYSRYYAVQAIPCDTAKNGGRLSELTFQNTRIRIVNYHISFDWEIGSRRNDIEKVTLTLLADYHDGNGPREITVNGSNEIDLEMIKDDEGKNVNDYYITNLPKYTQTGQIISYSVKEVKINGMPFVRKKCVLDNDTIAANIEYKDYVVNPDSNSDDLIPIVITNYFTGTTDCTVNKIWLDDTNQLNTRTDLYIRLYRHTTDPDNHSADQPVRTDYLWKKHPEDSENHWTYTYDNLAKYDPKGFRYEYYIKEIVNNLKTNDYQTYYQNAVHMTAKNVATGDAYTSNDSVFTIPSGQISSGSISVKISGLDALDPYFDGDQTVNKNYIYRVTDISGDELTSGNGVTVTTSAPVNGKVDVTVTYQGAADKDFKFRLQRKVTAAMPIYEDGELVDDMYRDVPDYFDTGTNPSTYNDPDGTRPAESDGTTYGRAYDNGTITNKLVGSVTIDVRKLWQSIDPTFEAQNYPIADVFLYANIKSDAQSGKYAASVNADGKGFDEGGYALIGGDSNSSNALGELMNIIQISYSSNQTPGSETYHFTGRRTIRTSGQNVQYQGDTDYVQYDDNIEGFTGAGTALLDKYDENGALIRYSLRERAINGYAYRISNDTIINEYNGGDRVQVKVTKNWKNMTVKSKFPTVRFTLHQCYVGKNAQTGKYELMEYNTFEQSIRATNSDPVSYVFGIHDKDILYRYSPTGQEFFYYVTEELVDVNNQGRVSFRKKYTVDQETKEISLPEVMTYTYQEGAQTPGSMVLTDDTKLAGLGFVCTITESDEDSFKADQNGIITVPRSEASGMSESSGGTISVKVTGLTAGTYTVQEVDPAAGTNALSCSQTTEEDGTVTLVISKELPLDDPPEEVFFKIFCDGNLVTDAKAVNTHLDTTIPIFKRVDVTNDYSPDEDYFRSNITIDKNWNLYSKSEQNPLNGQEFKDINNYRFTLKRKTKYIFEKVLFEVQTGDLNSNTGVPDIDLTNSDREFSITIKQPDNTYYTSANCFVGMTAQGIRTDIDNANVAYYQADMIFTKPDAYGNKDIDVTVKVNKETRQVVIEGLAIYAQDGTLYTYMIEENQTDHDVFTPESRKQQRQISPVYASSVQLQTAANTVNDATQPLRFKLQRRIKDKVTYTVDGSEIRAEDILTNNDAAYPVKWGEYYARTLTEGNNTLYTRTGEEGSYTYTDSGKVLVMTVFSDVTSDIITSEKIVAEDAAPEHRFRANSSGVYTIPAEYAQPSGPNEKEFNVLISGFPAAIDGHTCDYKTSDGNYSIDYDSGNQTVNILVKKTVPKNNNGSFSFHVERKIGDAAFAPLTGQLPDAVDDSRNAHTITETNGIYTVPAVYAVLDGDQKQYAVNLSHLPDKCAQGEYLYRMVDADSGNTISSVTTTSAQVIGGVINMGLNNQLKYFTFRLNKVFGTEYDVTDENNQKTIKYDDLAVEDYSLYFMENAFLSRLRYTVDRKKQGGEWKPYINLKVDQNTETPIITPHIDENNPEDSYSDIQCMLTKYPSGPEKGKFYFEFKYLPRTDGQGNVYQYRIREHEVNVGEFVRIYYPQNSTQVPDDNAPMTESSDDLSFTLQYSTDEGVSYSPATNLSAAPTISIPGATFDLSTGSVTVPRRVSMQRIPLSSSR